MKKIFLLLTISIFLFSCSKEDDETTPVQEAQEQTNDDDGQGSNQGTASGIIRIMQVRPAQDEVVLRLAGLPLR